MLSRPVYHLFPALLIFAFSLIANAQVDTVTLATQQESIALSDTGFNVFIRYNGSEQSEPFRLRTWVSFDPQIDDQDLVGTSDVYEGLFNSDFSTVINPREFPLAPIEFRFPLPGDVLDLPEGVQALARLPGDDLNPRDWIGRSIYFRVCILTSDNVELECNSPAADIGVPMLVTPPKVLPGIGNLVVPNASKGVSNQYIDLVWPAQTDNGNLLIDNYRVLQFAPDFSFTRLEFPISDLDILTGSTGQQFYRKRLTQIVPGDRYEYESSACLGDVCTATDFVDFSSGDLIVDLSPYGNAYENIVASTDVNGRVEITWDPFSLDTVGYWVTRCEIGEPDDQCALVNVVLVELVGPCIPVEGGDPCFTKSINSLVLTSFSDTDVERGRSYVYTVEACEELISFDDPMLGCLPEATYTAAISSPGESGLVDDFEDDDNPQQATVVNRQVSQLHSFDTPDDADWLRIVNTRTQSIVIRTSGETSEDTKITLYTSDVLGNPNDLSRYEVAIASFTAGVPFASFATLITDELEAGEYFIKVEQESIVGLPPLSVFNYTLDIELKGPVTVAPIIGLLLSD